MSIKNKFEKWFYLDDEEDEVQEKPNPAVKNSDSCARAAATGRTKKTAGSRRPAIERMLSVCKASRNLPKLYLLNHVFMRKHKIFPSILKTNEQLLSICSGLNVTKEFELSIFLAVRSMHLVETFSELARIFFFASLKMWKLQVQFPIILNDRN